jgi:hypothetical protein
MDIPFKMAYYGVFVNKTGLIQNMKISDSSFKWRNEYPFKKLQLFQNGTILLDMDWIAPDDYDFSINVSNTQNMTLEVVELDWINVT